MGLSWCRCERPVILEKHLHHARSGQPGLPLASFKTAVINTLLSQLL